MESTLAALELARLAHSRLHFISSMGVVAGLNHGPQAVTLDAAPLDRYSGYTASKWLCEQLLLPLSPDTATIYRLGNISGSTLTGLSNPSDAIMHFIQLLMKERVICTDSCPQIFPLLPANETARILADLLTSSGPLPSSFHHVAATRYMTLAHILLALASCGMPVQHVKHEVFAERVANLQPGDPMFHAKSLLVGSLSSPNLDLPPDQVADSETSVAYLCRVIQALGVEPQ